MTKIFPKKAWEAFGEDGGIYVFATHDITARRIAAEELYDDADCIQGLVLKRRPEWDQYAEKRRIPNEALYEAGWRLECSGCGGSIEEGGNDEEAPVFEEGDGVCFCGETCRQDHKAWQRRHLRRKQRVIKWAIARASYAWGMGLEPDMNYAHISMHGTNLHTLSLRLKTKTFYDILIKYDRAPDKTGGKPSFTITIHTDSLWKSDVIRIASKDLIKRHLDREKRPWIRKVPGPLRRREWPRRVEARKTMQYQLPARVG